MRHYIDLMHAMLSESRVRNVQLFLGEPDLIVLLNPTADQIATAVNRAEHSVLRGHLGHQLIVWDGGVATHDHVDDSGEFGKLRCIRFVYSNGNLTVMRYGREQEHPDNPETHEEFATPDDIIEYVENSPLVRRAFGDTTIRLN